MFNLIEMIKSFFSKKKKVIITESRPIGRDYRIEETADELFICYPNTSEEELELLICYDGNVINRSLILREYELRELPDNLIVFGRFLEIDYLKKIPKNLTVHGDFIIGLGLFKKFPRDIKVYGNVIIHYSSRLDSNSTIPESIKGDCFCNLNLLRKKMK